jgi:hypothetical protein
MKRKWISVAILFGMLAMLSIVGLGALGAQSAPAAPPVVALGEETGPLPDPALGGSDPELVVDPPAAWHDPACAGDKERYTLTFTNNSSETLTNVSVTDLLPTVCPEGCDVCAWNDNDWPYDDCSPGATYNGQRTLSWHLASVGPGDTVTLYVEVRFWSYIPDGQVLRNCLTVTSDQLGPESACSEVVARQCVTPTPTKTPTRPAPTKTRTPSATPTFTPGPSVTATFTPGPLPTTPIAPLYKLYFPDIYANHVVIPPTATPTPTATATPAAPIVQCYRSEPGVGLMYRVDPSLFQGYAGASATDYSLLPITSPPAPAGWNQPGFVPDSTWRAPVEVWWAAWNTGDWPLRFPATIIGMKNAKGKQEGLDGTTHLIRQTFELTPPEPGRHITAAVLDMWSDNKTAWYWNGELLQSDAQLQVGNHPLFPDHVGSEGGTYLLAVQNSNDYMHIENPQGTAYQICVTWAR